MSKCKAATELNNADLLIRFIESIHIGGQPIQIKPGTEVLFNPRNLESLVENVDVQQLNKLATQNEIEESVLSTVIAHIDQRFNEFEKRIEELLQNRK